MSHTWMSYVTHINEACHTYEWVMSYIWMPLFWWVPWPIYKSDTTHLHVWHEPFTCVTCLHPHLTVHVNGSCHTCKWGRVTLINGSRHVSIHSLTCVSRHVSMESCHTYECPYSHECHDPFIRVTWLIHMCDMTHSSVWHVSIHIWQSPCTRMGWLRWVGSFKL